MCQLVDIWLNVIENNSVNSYNRNHSIDEYIIYFYIVCGQ
jgi:hypothetical protein